MGTYFQKKRDNLDLILKTIGQHPDSSARVSESEDGFFAGKPLLLWLESTARCNLRCAKCGHAVDPPGSARTLPRNLSDAVVDEADDYFAAAVKVRTSGYGEMFLYSRLRRLVERIKHFECWAEGTTNGVVIDHSEVDWLVDLGYDQLVFSIDGVEPATMQRLRGADLDKIWNILGYIRDRKEQSGKTRPHIVVGFVAQADNVHELPALVRKLAEFNVCFLAVNTLHYKKYVPGGDDLYARTYRECSLANVERGAVEALIEEGRELAAQARIPYGVYIDMDRLYADAAADAVEDDEEGEFVTIAGQRQAVPPPPDSLPPFYCVYPWTSMYITARGSTTVCCSMRGDVGTVLNSGDIDRVWNGPALREIRQSITRGEVHSQCRYCVSRNRHLSSFVDLEGVKSALALQEETPAAAPPGPVAETPSAPLFGYFDTPELEGRGLERVRIAGWAASGRHGAPVRELKVRLDGRELATVTSFYARPDVAAHYGRKDLLQSGWQTLVNLPALPPGDYQLMAEATDPDGVRGAVGPARVRITG
jgi:MoaA/NifB/PqqE/SkfB family radical SAM enzyme